MFTQELQDQLRTKWQTTSSIENNRRLFDKYHTDGNPMLSRKKAWELCKEVNLENDTKDMLDLHAQTLSNAIQLVDDKLAELDFKQEKGKLQATDELSFFVFVFICGEGRHSEAGQAVLKRKVLQHLEKKNKKCRLDDDIGNVYAFYVVNDDKREEGVTP